MSSGGRPGAVAEADDLEEALQAAGCDVIGKEWSDACMRASQHNREL